MKKLFLSSFQSHSSKSVRKLIIILGSYGSLKPAVCTLKTGFMGPTFSLKLSDTLPKIVSFSIVKNSLNFTLTGLPITWLASFSQASELFDTSTRVATFFSSEKYH